MLTPRLLLPVCALLSGALLASEGFRPRQARRPPRHPAPVVLSEVLYDAGGGREFIELLARRQVDLTGWSVTDGEDETFTFSSEDGRFTCPEPFVLRPGERVVLWEGAGNPVCGGPQRQLFLDRTAFLPADGDDLRLLDDAGACQDLVVFESGPQAAGPPSGCSWSGAPPGNGGVVGIGISRFDGAPLVETDGGADWEKSGRTTTRGPASPGEANEASADGDGDGVLDVNDNCVSMPNPGQADVCRALPVTVAVPILEQDIRSDFSTWAQHRQQPTTRIGVRSGNRYRSLGWLPLSGIPADAVVDDVRLVYWTTSGNPEDISPNGDVGNSGAAVDVELRKLLKPWNYDEPRTHDPDLADNDTPAQEGETSWIHARFPKTWELPGASGPSDSVAVARVGAVAGPFDTRFDFAAPALVALVQSWIDEPSTNHGFMLKASDPHENQTGSGNRKILCGKGFPLETSTLLERTVAENHRPHAYVTYHRR